MLTQLAQWAPVVVILFAVVSGVIYQSRSTAYLERRLEQVDRRIDDSNHRIEDLRSDMNQRFEQVNQRFASLEKLIESQFSRVYDRLDRLEGPMEHPVLRP